MKYLLNIAETITLTINAADRYSASMLAVNNNEQYTFKVNSDQKWKDWYVSANADGYFNFLAALLGQRVKGAKCFCLCGAYDEDDSTAFVIGSFKTIVINKNGTINFFANDSRGFYFNNSGSIQLSVTRNS